MLKKILTEFWLSLLILSGLGFLISVLETLGIAFFIPLFQVEGLSQYFERLPVWARGAMDFLINSDLSRRLIILAVLIVGIYVMRLILLYIVARMSLSLRLTVVRKYLLECMEKLMHSGMGFYNARRIADLQLLFKWHIESHLGEIVLLFCNSLPAVLTTVALIFVLFVVSWKITLPILALGSVATLIVSRLTTMLNTASHAHLAADLRFNKIILDILNGMKTIRIFAQEKRMLGVFMDETDKIGRAGHKVAELAVLIGPIFETVGMAIVALILIIVALGPGRTGDRGVGLLILAFLIVLVRLIPSLKQINHARGTIMSRIASIKNIENFMRIVERGPEARGGYKVGRLSLGLEFQNVSFSYQRERALAIKGISFAIREGQKVGIVGRSGSGKTTIAELLLRFYDPTEGKIMVDGIDLREADTVAWRSRIGVVAQDVFLFNETIRTNIAFARPDATDDEIKAAARQAHIHEFILTLPQGYDTFIGERGVLLSGGQRQRIAIARAILNEPDILIFDEATSALDTESEKIIQEALAEISRGRTVILIAHRLSTVANCDWILVMDEGRIVEQGTHADLLKSNGKFMELVSAQTIN